MSYQAKGLQAWLLQRLTGVFMALYILYVLGVVVFSESMNYQQWSGWLSHPLMNTATGLFFLTLAYHAWVGMRDIVIDYVLHDAFRLLVLTLISLFLISSSLYLLKILFSLTLIV